MRKQTFNSKYALIFAGIVAVLIIVGAIMLQPPKSNQQTGTGNTATDERTITTTNVEGSGNVGSIGGDVGNLDMSKHNDNSSNQNQEGN